MRTKPLFMICVAPIRIKFASVKAYLLREPEHEQERGIVRGVVMSCFWSDASLVNMLGDTPLLFREISVRPSSQFISSHNHELSNLSYSRGSACRQVNVSTAAEPKYLLNPSSLFNYPHVLEKWCKPSRIYDTLPASPMVANTRVCGKVDDEQKGARDGIQVRIIKRRLNEWEVWVGVGGGQLKPLVSMGSTKRSQMKVGLDDSTGAQCVRHLPLDFRLGLGRLLVALINTTAKQTTDCRLFKHANPKCSVNSICEARLFRYSVYPVSLHSHSIIRLLFNIIIKVCSVQTKSHGASSCYLC